MGAMPSPAVQPGARLAGRYRLESAVPTTGGPPAPSDTWRGPTGTVWRAFDELLVRPVEVRMIPAGTALAEAALTAARTAASLPEPWFIRVFDADVLDGHAYLVGEWVEATHLGRLLADGPLHEAEAARIAYEVASALDAARAAGVPHGRLRPEHVLRTDDGQVRLAIFASLPDGPEGVATSPTDDARSAGSVLYAGLTGRWPERGASLPVAPQVDGRPCSPRQVRAGVPQHLDDVATRALGLPGRRGAPPLRNPAAVAAALARTASKIDPLGYGGARAGRPDDTDSTLPPVGGGPRGVDDTPALLASPPEPGRTARLTWIGGGLLLTCGLLLAGWQVAMTARGDEVGRGPQPGPSATAPDSAGSAGSTGSADGDPSPGTPVAITDVRDFDPQGDGKENPGLVEAVIDGDPATGWRTRTYYDQLGPDGLKTGVGLLLDLGRPTDVGTVTVQLSGQDSDVQLLAAETPGRAIGDFRLVGATEGAGPTVTVLPEEQVRARYLLVWFTRLPAVEGGFRGEVQELTVRERSRSR